MPARAEATMSDSSREETATPHITTCLWFDKDAEEAANFYVKVFSDAGRPAKIGRVARFGRAAAKASGQAEGSVMTIEFELDGNTFLGLNGGPVFKPSQATSFIISCRTQQAIDHFWNRLSECGKPGRCGWIDRDKFGISWQVVPAAMGKYACDPDPARAERVMSAVMAMTKLDIGTLERAYNGANTESRS